jgi:hypothetical protein
VKKIAISSPWEAPHTYNFPTVRLRRGWLFKNAKSPRLLLETFTWVTLTANMPVSPAQLETRRLKFLAFFDLGLRSGSKPESPVPE